MKVNRRQVLQAAAASTVAGSAARALQVTTGAAPGAPNWATVRDDFPWINRRLWLTAADFHPLSIHSQRAVEEYMKVRVNGPAEGSSRDRVGIPN